MRERDGVGMKLLIATVLLIASVSALIYFQTPRSKVYPCSLAEISPDFPVDVKIQCRKLLKKTPRMEDGCVVQESQGKEVKTCG